MLTASDLGAFLLVFAGVAALWFIVNFGKYIIRWDDWKKRRRKR